VYITGRRRRVFALPSGPKGFLEFRATFRGHFRRACGIFGRVRRVIASEICPGKGNPTTRTSRFFPRAHFERKFDVERNTSDAFIRNFVILRRRFSVIVRIMVKETEPEPKSVDGEVR
jgi:hypothetical protein